MFNQDNALPADFDGVFRFTNFTDTDFKARWANIEYTFPAQRTIPLVIPGCTPEEVQHIRKKFAKELAIEVFYKTRKFQDHEAQTPAGSGMVASIYSDADLAPFIARCLEPLPMGNAIAKVLPKAREDVFRTDEEGNNVTQVLDKKKSLLQEGSSVVA